MIMLVLIFGIAAWLLKGYINYVAYYNQALIADYIDRNGLPYPTPDDFKESENELSKSRCADIKAYVFIDRFPFRHIPVKYLPWR